MDEIFDFLWKANMPVLKNIFKETAKSYEPDFIQKIKHYNKNKLIALAIYFDSDGVRWFLEANYLTKNKHLFFKDWRNLINDKNIHTFKAKTQVWNYKMINFLKKMKFEIIGDDGTIIYFEYRRS